MPSNYCKYVNILGVNFANLDEAACVRKIVGSLQIGQGGWVITPNLDILRRYVQDSGFKKLADGATLFVADGMPLVWASKLQGSPLRGRVPGSSLISTLCAEAAIQGKSVFLLGGDPGTADEAAAVLTSKYPGLKVVGTLCPPLGFENDAQQLLSMRKRLALLQPDIVYVALGCPKQEWLINELKDCLPNAWWLGLGISFSFLAGRIKRAPAWMQQLGLEWVHRLFQEPKRLAKRYLAHGIPFAIYLLGHAFIAGRHKVFYENNVLANRRVASRPVQIERRVSQ